MTSPQISSLALISPAPLHGARQVGWHRTRSVMSASPQTLEVQVGYFLPTGGILMIATCRFLPMGGSEHIGPATNGELVMGNLGDVRAVGNIYTEEMGIWSDLPLCFSVPESASCLANIGDHYSI
ncbi:hypothetical protein DFH09DRAFT_1077445 [Mycena vulgaris]|nr:hypothetical protein DFH09DRAFT_1077445 [Mycena vulgaris]